MRDERGIRGIFRVPGHMLPRIRHTRGIFGYYHKYVRLPESLVNFHIIFGATFFIWRPRHRGIWLTGDEFVIGCQAASVLSPHRGQRKRFGVTFKNCTMSRISGYTCSRRRACAIPTDVSYTHVENVFRLGLWTLSGPKKSPQQPNTRKKNYKRIQEQHPYFMKF